MFAVCLNQTLNIIYLNVPVSPYNITVEIQFLVQSHARFENNKCGLHPFIND